jgi:uncharacterized membrane protein YbhN (UPF0104 family)
MQQISPLKVLNTIHKAMLTGQVLFAAVGFYLVYSNTLEPPAKELEKILQVVALTVTAACVYAGITLFKKRLQQIREMQTGAKEKFEKYRSACILQWALTEAPVLLCIICLFLTGNYAFLALAAVLIILFAMMAPSKIKIILHLQIGEQEVDDL